MFRALLFPSMALLLIGVQPLSLSAQDIPEPKVMRVDALEVAPGIITPEVARRFQAAPDAVESRIKGAVLATLSQELSSSKLLRLAVRDESLNRLAKEWKHTEQLGTGKSEDAQAGPGADDAQLLAYAKIEDFVADYKAITNAAGAAARWKLRITISLEVTERKSGTKKVLKEDFEDIGSKIIEFARAGAPDFDSGQIRGVADGVAKKLGMRVLDVYCPPRIIQVRGTMFIVDRGRAAGMKENQIVELTEPAEDSLGTDAGFPVGKARVKSVKEETCLMELISAEGESDLSKVQIKKTFTISRPLEAADPAPSNSAQSSLPGQENRSSKKR